MTINKIIMISSIVPVIQHGRQGLCRLNLTGMVANHLFESIHNFLRSKQVILPLTSYTCISGSFVVAVFVEALLGATKCTKVNAQWYIFASA